MHDNEKNSCEQFFKLVKLEKLYTSNNLNYLRKKLSKFIKILLIISYKKNLQKTSLLIVERIFDIDEYCTKFINIKKKLRYTQLSDLINIKKWIYLAT